jgi:heat shock protein HslJ
MYRLSSVALLLMALWMSTSGSARGSGGRDGEVSALSPLAGTAWVLIDPSGQTPVEGTEVDAPVTLRFETNGVLTGSDGCNRYRGSYVADGAALRIPNGLSTTRMACPEALMRRASAFATALGRAASFVIDDDRLDLKDDMGRAVATFQAERRSLVGTPWQVVAYNNGAQAAVSVLEGTRITARFGEDGRVAGIAGCNEYATAYETAETSLTIGHPEATRRACAEPEGVMAQEARFLGALRSAESFRLEGRKLTLRTAGKALAVTLVWDFAAPSPAETAPASKILFDLERLDAEGLQGPPDGLRALHYEYCIPHRQDAVEEVTAIDPTLTIQQGSPGRIGCADEELLCLGHTHQPGFRAVLEQLAALPMVREIREAFFE